MFQRHLALESSRKVSLSMQKLKLPELRLTMKGAHCLAQSCTAHSRLHSSACREIASWLAVVWGFSRAAAALWGMCNSQAKHSQAICKVCWTELLQINLAKITWKRNLPKHAKPGYETPVEKALKLIDVVFGLSHSLPQSVFQIGTRLKQKLPQDKTVCRSAFFWTVHVNIHVRHVTFLKLTQLLGPFLAPWAASAILPCC